MFQFTMFIIISMFVLDIVLSILNYRYRHQPLPDNVKDIYNKEDYKTWFKYTMEVFRLSMIGKIVNTTVLILFLILDVFPLIAKVVNEFSSNTIMQTLLFLGLYSFISYVLNIGLQIYRTFNIEQRYGFNKSTIKTFILDQLKGMVMSIVLGGGLIFILLTLYQKLGSQALGYAWLIIIILYLLINILYTKVFIRLFNKLTPLKEGELFDHAKDLTKKAGYEFGKISIMDASKRSSRLNAFFSGFGKFKHIIIFDTLIEKCTTKEIISVLAHEVGHSKHKDVQRNFLIAMVQLGVYLALLGFFLTSTTFASSFGFTDIHLGFGLILFGILMEPLGILLGLFFTALSRKAEYKADAYAADLGCGPNLVSALKILSRENFSNLTPHPLVVKLTYSHPPVSLRIKALSNNQQN